MRGARVGRRMRELGETTRVVRIRSLKEKELGETTSGVRKRSLKAVLSSCKRWEASVLGEAAAAPHEFLGFVTMNSKVYSLRFHRDEEEDLVDVSLNQVDLLNEWKVSKVYHCDGLVLCVAVAEEDDPKLVLWNPYLCQTRCVGPREKFNVRDRHAIGYGYDSKKKQRDHKILRFVDDNIFVYDWRRPERIREVGYEIYDIRSDSWRVLEVVKSPVEWRIDMNQRGVSVNGNAFFFAHYYAKDDPHHVEHVTEVQVFLLCFDFTKESFGPRLPLPPFLSESGDSVGDCVTLSTFLRGDDEQLALLFGGFETGFFEIWVSLTVDPNHVSWSNFCLVETGPLSLKLNHLFGGSFFVDEENKVAVLFELDPTKQHTAFVFGQDGYLKSSVNLGQVAPILEYRSRITNLLYKDARPPLVCSSPYRPSLVQLNHQPHKRKNRDDDQVLN